MKKLLQNLPKYLFIFSLCVLFFGYGFLTDRNKIFPYHWIHVAREGLITLICKVTDYKGRWYYIRTNETRTIPVFKKDEAYPGLSLVTEMEFQDTIAAKVIAMDGTPVVAWDLDWFKIWPDAKHIPPENRPKSRPGTHVHGAIIMDNGDLVFNYETLGLVRMDVCGNVVWRLPYRTHHSIFRDEDGNLWVPGQKNHTEKLADFPNYIPPFIEYTLIKVSPGGKIMKEISIMDLLKQNGLQSLLYMSTSANRNTRVTGDTLHVNDVEVFPESMSEGFLKHGNMLISIRNINAILIVSDEDSLKIKAVLTGDFVRQHDPDFVDGNTISIFDNNNIAPDTFGQQSRILMLSLPDGHSTVYYTGNKQNPFYTNIMGKHQWLKNGDLLITETMHGRAFEINKKGDIVWEYTNYLGNNYAGIVEEVQRLDRKFTREYFDKRRQECAGTNPN